MASLASLFLTTGNPLVAFFYADRLCRTFSPTAIEHLLRFEALRQIAGLDDAKRDLLLAIEVDPTDPAVIEAASIWQPAIKQAETAGDRTPFLIPRAPESSAGRRRADGDSSDAAPPLRSHEETVDHRPLQVEAGASPPETATEDKLAWDRQSRASGIPQGPPVESEAGRPVRGDTDKRVDPNDAPDAAPGVTVIIPVYEDLDATRTCIETVLAQRADIPIRVVVVDDASPNQDLSRYLAQHADAQRLTLILNPTNLGFATSVNRALDSVSTGDVLLLNADTILPTAAIARLKQSAHSKPGIATLTPLSNNGEETSFPKPGEVNDLQPLAMIEIISAAAADANGLGVVEIPNGIGFCIYITRSCLDLVPRLPEVYARGYYEDVEFCLRAAERGLINVCATGVYVGHAGARSFRIEKRTLVVRNFELLDERFPRYGSESAAFSKADPLSAARGAIENLLPPRGVVRLLLGGGEAVPIIAERIAALRCRDIDAVIMLWTASPRLCRVTLRASNGSWPQSLSYDLNTADGMNSLRQYLARLPMDRAEIADARDCPAPLLDLVLGLARPLDLLCGDFRWFQTRHHAHIDGSSLDEYAAFNNSTKRALLGLALQRAESIVPVDRIAAALADKIFFKLAVREPVEVPPDAPVEPRPRRRLGVLVPSPSARVDGLLITIARQFRRLGDSVTFIVFGRCVNDLAVMSAGNVFVTGGVPDGECAVLGRLYQLDALFSPYRTCLFGPIDRASRKLGLAKSYFDWSFGSLNSAPCDLSLDPRIPDETVAKTLVAWCSDAVNACVPAP